MNGNTSEGRKAADTPLIPFKRLWRQVNCADSREIREPRRSWRQLSAAVQVPGYGRLNGCGMEEAAARYWLADDGGDRCPELEQQKSRHSMFWVAVS